MVKVSFLKVNCDLGCNVFVKKWTWADTERRADNSILNRNLTMSGVENALPLHLYPDLLDCDRKLYEV